MSDIFQEILERVSRRTPLVHCITNYVTVNDCANILLACGGSPIMADDAGEVEEITALCDGLVLNIGTLNQRTVSSMLLAGRRANQLGHPVVLDPVGAGASALRTRTALELVEQLQLAVIRGNLSEIKTLWKGSGETKGVDVSQADNDSLSERVCLARELSRKTGAVVVITGAVDVVATASAEGRSGHSGQAGGYFIRNGHPQMAKITGSGCMLSAMTAAYCAANPDSLLEAAACATAVMGYSGQLAWQRVQKEPNAGTGSLRTYLIDGVSRMDWTRLKGGIQIERF